MPQYYNPITGETEELDETEAVDRAAETPGQGVREATPYEVDRAASGAAYGSAGQQALGYVEKAIPGARLAGRALELTDERAQRGRAQYLERENPITAGVAAAAPDIALAMLGGGAAAVAARAARMTTVGGRMLAGATEGLVGGYLGEAERAFVDDEDFSVGNMFMYGVGGELLGRGVAAGGRAVGRNVLALAERRALAASAREATEATARTVGAAEKAAKQAAKTWDDTFPAARQAAKRGYVPDDVPDAPIQHVWGADAAAQVADALPPASRTPEVTRALHNMVAGRDGRAVYEAASNLADALDPDDAMQGELRAAVSEGLRREDLWTAPVVERRAAHDAAREAALRPDAAFDAPDAARASLDALDELGADTKALREQLAAGDAARTARAAADSLPQAEPGGGIAGDVTDAMAGAALGAVSSSLGLGAVGALGLRAVRYSGLLKNLSKGGAAKIRDVARSLARPAGAVARAIPAAGAVLAAERGPERRSPLTRFTGPSPSPQAAYAARKGDLQAIMRDPMAFATEAAGRFGALPQTHPSLYPAMAQRVGTMVAYLQANAPPGIVRSLRYPNGLPPTQEALAQYAAIYEAVTDPASTLDDLKAGTVRPEAIEALRAVHPDLYQSVQYAILRELASAGPGETPTQTKVRLDLLFQLDGAATPAFSSKVAATVKSQEQAQAERSGRSLDTTSVSPPAGVASIASGPTNVGGGQGTVSR